MLTASTARSAWPIPTALEFACIYPASMPARFADEYAMLSDNDKIGAIAKAREIADRFLRLGIRAGDPIDFLARKPWRADR